jgi:hypothetical protein
MLQLRFCHNHIPHVRKTLHINLRWN